MCLCQVFSCLPLQLYIVDDTLYLCMKAYEPYNLELQYGPTGVISGGNDATVSPSSLDEVDKAI